VDSAALDRALCERLGIAPTQHEHQVIDEVHASEQPYFCGTRQECARWLAELVMGWDGLAIREHIVYPALSTSEAGFSILWKALKRNGWSVFLSDDEDDCWAQVSKTISLSSGAADTAPLALALAAAAALGIEVQP